MEKSQKRRSFLKSVVLGGTGVAVGPNILKAGERASTIDAKNNVQQKAPVTDRKYNDTYTGEYLNRLAFPVGGLGAGMFCLEGTGAISHMSIRNTPDIFNEPPMFAAIAIKDVPNAVKVLEGPVPMWKRFGQRGSGLGDAGATYGLPRFRSAQFTARFPFGVVELRDEDVPLQIAIKGWSPFIPTDEDNSSLPVGALEYEFANKSNKDIDAIFSYNAKNFLVNDDGAENSIGSVNNGFVLMQKAKTDKPQGQGNFAAFTDDDNTVVDHCWFRGGWWDPLTMAWNTIQSSNTRNAPPVDKNAPGASLFVPFTVKAGASKTIKLMAAWYVPDTDLRIGEIFTDEKKDCFIVDAKAQNGKQTSSPTHKPWYSNKFSNINGVVDYWRQNYNTLYKNTKLFSDTFYNSSLPQEVIEAIAANLTILKSPTVLRQYDGRLWCWEGCGDETGSCHGSCTHVWNYAQAISHLFPALERTLRNTEFCENQNSAGHQGFRANMPISPLKHDFHAASDGQLGGIMKVYRDWRISGDNEWLGKIYPLVVTSMDYCIATWDPQGKGVVEEPHHNTYDIEFWGPDGMISSFYLGALTSITLMGKHLNKDVSKYEDLYKKGKVHLETNLYDGEYFFQDIEYKNLKAENPATAQSFGGDYSAEAIELLKQEGPKYQYGKGCLSDGILGAWIGSMCGLPSFVDDNKVSSHLLAVHKYNLKASLKEHANPQRPGYALDTEGGLLLCTWPKGGKLSLPFVYSDEVWTGIEYQVAAHLMEMGHVQQGLDIVKLCRNRYDGRVRNPFNEYECGHWYARAMSSYGMLQALTGVRYDAVDRSLHVDSKVGDFTSFLSTATGFGTVSFKAGKPSVKVVYGKIDIDKTFIGDKAI